MVSKEFLKKEIFTIPNMLSFLRLILIPVFAVLYLKGYWGWSIAALAVGTVSDFFDGMLARKLNQVSELGMLLDPVADKLSQAAIVVCLGIRYPVMWYMFIMEVIKECYLMAAGAYTLKKYGTKMKGAKWYGKIATAIMDASLLAILVFPGLSDTVRLVLVIVCAAAMFLDMLLYHGYYVRLWRELKTSGVKGQETLLPKE